MCLKDYNWDEYIEYFKEIRETCFEEDDVKSDFKNCTK